MLKYLQGSDNLGATKKTKTKKRTVAKIAIAPARNAFLLVVSLNLLGLGKKMYLGWKKDSSRLINWWVKLGGKPDALKKAIVKGSKQNLSGGTLGIATEVTLTSALPIIVAVSKILSDMGVTTKKEKKDEDTKIESLKKSMLDDSSIDKSSVNLPEGSNTAILKNSSDSETSSTKTLLYIGGAIALLGGGYLLTREN